MEEQDPGNWTCACCAFFCLSAKKKCSIFFHKASLSRRLGMQAVVSSSNVGSAKGFAEGSGSQRAHFPVRGCKQKGALTA